MNLNPTSGGSTLYDVLDLRPDASQQEVREAYHRTKSAYTKDSLALYTLISAGEREEILRRVEEAYEVLSDSDRRREYDRCHSLLDPAQEEIAAFPHSAADYHGSKKIVSIDRVPPMDASASTDELLVAPSTDFSAEPGAAATPPRNDFVAIGAPAPAPEPEHSAAAPLPPNVSEAVSLAQPEAHVDTEIKAEHEWKGTFIRKIRDARKVSMEELSHATKISKTYITAIEDEEFKKLPAAVFVRGFLLQICRILKIPSESVVPPYMARYNQARAGD